MKAKKVLAASVAVAMALGTMALPAFAHGETGENISGEVALAAASVLPEAVDGVITLTEDLTLAETAVFSEGEVTIDLAGFTLTTADAEGNNTGNAPNKSVLSLSGTAKVTIMDSSSGKTGKVIAGTATNCRGTSSSTINMNNGGTLVIDGATVQGAKTINCREGGMAIKCDHRNRPEIQVDIQIINGARVVGGEDCTDLDLPYDCGSDDNTYGATAIYTKTNGTITITDSEVIGGKGVGFGRKGGRGIEMDAFSYDGYPWDEEYTNMVCGTLNISGSVIRGGDSEESNASGVALMTASQGVISDSQIYGGNAPGIGGAAVYVGSIAPTSEFVRCTITGGNGETSWAGNAVEIYEVGGFKATDCTIIAGKGVNNGGNYGSAVWYYEETKAPTVLENCELVVQPENQVAAIGGTARGQSEITVNGSLKIKSNGEDAKGSDLKGKGVHITWTETPEILYANADGTEYKKAVVFVDGAGYFSIAEALEAAKDGSVVEILPGTYEEPITMPLKSLTLKGNGDVLLKGGIQFASGEVPEGTEITIEGLNFENKGIKLVAWGATRSLGNIKALTIKNNKFSKIQGEKNIYAIHINNGDDAIPGLSILNNEFQDNEVGAFYATVRGKLAVTENKIMNSGMNGGTLIFADNKGNAAESVTINGNQFIEWGLKQNDAGVREGRALRLSGFKAGATVDIAENAFLCTDAPEEHLKATGIQEGSTVKLDKNYWGEENPDFGSLLETEGKVEVKAYYQTLLEDGTLADPVVIVEELENVTKKLELEAVEGSNQVNVYVAGEDKTGTAAVVENLVAVDLALGITGSFSIIDVDVPEELNGKWDISAVGENRYLIKEVGISQEDLGNQGEQLGNVNNDLDGSRIHIATLTLGGYGKGVVTAAGGDGANDVAQRSRNNNIVLSSNLAQTTLDFEIKPAQQTLTVNVAFPNGVTDNAAAYQDMKATVSGGDLTENIVLNFGSDGVAQKDGGYSFTQELTQNVSYTVTLEGAGYRTVRYTVNMNDDKTLNFWNNVKDEATVVEVGKDASAVKTTFLAGDIVKDNIINLYDLSAVVSYFGTENLVTDHPAYAKYDLNRDGKIDSKDVAMVLVSWGN